MDSGYKALVYGQSGSGKTTFWATWPGPILTLVVSGGDRPGELRSIDTPEYRKKINPQVLTDSSELKEMIAGAGDYETVVLDHVSGLQDLILKEILGLTEIPVQKNWGMATLQQYGQCTAQCKEILRTLLNLRSNVVIIGQEKASRAEGAASELMAPTVGVDLTDKLAGWLNPAVDYIVQAFKRPKMKDVVTKLGGKDHVTQVRDKGAEFCLRCEAHDVYTTKFRAVGGVTTDVIVNPTYEKFVATVNGTYDGK